MENFETIQKARQDLIGEIQAIIDYANHIETSNSQVAKNTWTHIMHEEMHHVGELLALLNYLCPEQKQHVQMGIDEFASQNQMN